jgi:signal transduction histidine kinase
MRRGETFSETLAAWDGIVQRKFARLPQRVRPQLVHLCLAAGFAIAIVAIVVITALSASRQNQQYLANQTMLADAEAAAAYNYLGGQLRQMVYYQDAFDNSVKHWNEKWITYEFGAYQDTMGNNYSVLIDRNGKLLFVHGPTNEPRFNAAALLHGCGHQALFRKVFDLGLSQWVPRATGVMVVGGRPYFAVASLITPEKKADLAAAIRSPIAALFLQPIDKMPFRGFAAGFARSDMQVVTDHSPDGDFRFHPLTDADGTPVAWLKWRPQLPGSAFMRRVTIPLVIVLAIFMLILVVVVSHWLALQRTILQSQAQARAAQEQSRLKSVFLGTISHELRTPLNAIIGYADMMCCEIFGPLGHSRNREYVHDIRTSGRHLLSIVNDLIEITRIEARDTCGDLDVFDAADAARQAIAQLAPAIDERRVRVELINPDQPAICRGSQISLTQAIERILANAVRHSPMAGRIELELSNARHRVEIEIRDHGEGIAPERLFDLQQPFGHPDNHMVAGRGLGFGIPIAKGLIQLMHGSFEIESKVDEGTRVRMYLPAGQAKPTSASPATCNGHGVFVPKRAAGSR